MIPDPVVLKHRDARGRNVIGPLLAAWSTPQNVIFWRKHVSENWQMLRFLFNIYPL